MIRNYDFWRNTGFNEYNTIKSILPSTDVIQLTLTRKMTTAQVVETSVTVNNNSPIQDYVHPDDQTQPTFEMTPGFKPFTGFKCWNNIAAIQNDVTTMLQSCVALKMVVANRPV